VTADDVAASVLKVIILPHVFLALPKVDWLVGEGMIPIRVASFVF
jgi:hypothetical protein